MKPRPPSLRDIQRGNNPRIRGLMGIAKLAFLDRNAQGMPRKDRADIKATARPHLRDALRWARRSRDALLDGNEGLHELLRDRARMYLVMARLAFYAPYVEQVSARYRALEENRASGSAEGAEKTRKAPGLDDVIRGAIKRNQDTRQYVKAWREEFKVSRQTVYNRIKKLKREKD